MDETNPGQPHKRRKRYSGTHPHTFAEKYKELNPEKYKADVEHVIERGDTPAGTHRSICLTEVLDILNPQPGEIAVDATLGYGGHAREILKKILPGGKLYGFDVDPAELAKTEARLRAEGFGPDSFEAVPSNFAALPHVLSKIGLSGIDMILADLGVSSMQIDNPERGFTYKRQGPLDMRMNPSCGESAAQLLRRIPEFDLAALLTENSDEPDAELIAHAIVHKRGEMTTTRALTQTIKAALSGAKRDAQETTRALRRTYQALRIAVNGELSSLDILLANLPSCLKPGGRVVILTFHSGEDERVVRAFAEGEKQGLYASIQDEEIRASAQERYSNPRSRSARLRWAIR
jgi:16S rRNA (cytosine1402-N4)-methyltransferase